MGQLEAEKIVISVYEYASLFVSTFQDKDRLNDKKASKDKQNQNGYIPYCTGEEFKVWLKKAISARIKDLPTGKTYDIHLDLYLPDDLYSLNKELKLNKKEQQIERVLEISATRGVFERPEKDEARKRLIENAHHDLTQGLKHDLDWLDFNRTHIVAALTEAVEDRKSQYPDEIWNIGLTAVRPNAQNTQAEKQSEPSRPINDAPHASSITLDLSPWAHLYCKNNDDKNTYTAKLAKVFAYYNRGKEFVNNYPNISNAPLHADYGPTKKREFADYHLDFKNLSPFSDKDYAYLCFVLKIDYLTFKDMLSKEESAIQDTEKDTLAARDVFMNTALAGFHHFSKNKNGKAAQHDVFKNPEPSDLEKINDAYQAQNLFLLPEIAAFSFASEKNNHKATALYPRAKDYPGEPTQIYMSNAALAVYKHDINFGTKSKRAPVELIKPSIPVDLQISTASIALCHIRQLIKGAFILGTGATVGFIFGRYTTPCSSPGTDLILADDVNRKNLILNSNIFNTNKIDLSLQKFETAPSLSKELEVQWCPDNSNATCENQTTTPLLPHHAKSK